MDLELKRLPLKDPMSNVIKVDMAAEITYETFVSVFSTIVYFCNCTMTGRFETTVIESLSLIYGNYKTFCQNPSFFFASDKC